MKRSIDGRYVALLALYGEYLQECGDFERVNRATLGWESGTFGWSLYRLQTEGLIGGCVFQPPNPGGAERLWSTNRSGLFLTREGVEKCEELLNVNRGERDAFKLTVLIDFLKDLGAGVIVALLERYLNSCGAAS